MSETTPPETMQAPITVRGRPRKTIEEQINSINNKTIELEEKRKTHNEKMKKYYHDNKEAILLQKKTKRDELKQQNKVID
jgi:hypothetical protein